MLFAAAVACTACGTDDATAPAPPAGALRFTAVTAGYLHSCALTAAGTAWCWGDNAAGTLGDGTRTSRLEPVTVTGLPPLAMLDAGAGHTCALSRDHVAWCWGQNDEGQLGDGSFTPRDRPVPVAGGLAFVQLSAGHAHACGLTAGGEAWCWGDHSRGQLGTGVAGGKSAVPVRVSGDRAFRHVVAGYYQTCALDSAGAAWCWGAGDSGQNGDGTTEDRAAPVRVSGQRTFTTLDAGDRFVCGISASSPGGSVWCWGANRHGELGAGAAAASPVPARVDGPAGANAVAASMGASTMFAVQPFACALDDGGTLCWGGRIRALRNTPGAAGLTPRFRATAVAVGADHVCVLSTAGHAYCGGGNFAGQLGDGSRTDRAALTPVRGNPHP